MKNKNTAYMKMGAAITKPQRKEWNRILSEMRMLSEHMLDMARFSGRTDTDVGEATRLHDLVSQLPLFDLDGKGVSRSGNAIKIF